MHPLPADAKPTTKARALLACPVPSLLLTRPVPQVFVYFQRTADGDITSPQVPTGSFRELAESAGVVSTDQHDRAL